MTKISKMKILNIEHFVNTHTRVEMMFKKINSDENLETEIKANEN